MTKHGKDYDGAVVRRSYQFIPNRRRRVLRGLTALALGSLIMVGVVWLLIGPVVTSIEERKVQAATPAQEKYEVPKRVSEPVTPPLSFQGFKPGKLISDQQFFDADAMDEEGIEKFIAKWNRGCRNGVDDVSCLADYVEDSRSYPPDKYCPGGFEGREGDTPAAIIYRVAQSCGVNPQVILTTLQKEQGLITSSGRNLNPTRYAIAMGFACPDEAKCDSHYFGLANQIYHGARQLKVYTVHPLDFGAKAHEENFVRYSPEVSCGGANVYIENQATANLYNYTPYQPNHEALAGKDGPCAAVGNLNFYAYFNAWFGPGAPDVNDPDFDEDADEDEG